MLRLFLRLYVFLMLPAIVAFVALMYVTDQVMAQLHAEQQRQRAGVAFDRAERIITDQRVPDWHGPAVSDDDWIYTRRTLAERAFMGVRGQGGL